jgi:hypothetical protein
LPDVPPNQQAKVRKLAHELYPDTFVPIVTNIPNYAGKRIAIFDAVAYQKPGADAPWTYDLPRDYWAKSDSAQFKWLDDNHFNQNVPNPTKKL